MQQGLLPLFPLQVVLFPGERLPLHIFEERYKEMIGEARRDNSEFGVLLANDKGVVSAGCTATIDKVLKEYPDGRLDILTVGRRRFELLLLNEERSFLRGAVEFFDDDDPRLPAPAELRANAIEGYNQSRLLNTEQNYPDADPADPLLSFLLAQCVPDLNTRQVLLASRSEAERVRKLAEWFPGHVARQKRIQHVKSVAPMNGHGLPPKLA